MPWTWARQPGASISTARPWKQPAARATALLAAHLAHALSLHGEHGEAVTIALDIALPALESGVSSAWCINELREVAAAAGAVRGVLELRERIDTARRGLPGIPGPGTGAPASLVSVPA